MKYYYCKECGVDILYRTKEILLKEHPTLANVPELIGEMEVAIVLEIEKND